MESILINIKKDTCFTIGITGALGSGKSTLAHKIKTNNPHYHIIEVDDLRRYVLWESLEEEHLSLREQLCHAFHLPVFDRVIFTDLIFSSIENLSLYRSIMTPVLKNMVQQHITQYNYCIVVWAYLIEEQYVDMVNIVYLTSCPFHVIKDRLSISNEDSHLHQRFVFEPSYQSRIDYLIQHHYTYIEYNNA